MRARHVLAPLVALFVLSLAPPQAEAAFTVSYKTIGTVFERPVFVTNAGDARLFVVEQNGRIKLINGASISTYHSMTDSVRSSADGGGGEEGLLGLAFHPDFRSSSAWGYGRFYVYYTGNDGNNHVLEYRVPSHSQNTTANATSRPLLKFYHPTHTNHNGGMLAFGRDRMLHVATGDGGGSGDPANNAEKTTTLLGKILRIDPTGSGRYDHRNPTDNPFYGRSGDDRIWSYGLRNPWRFSFDRTLGNLWIADVGQNAYEEINRGLANTTTRTGGGRGANYGWDAYEARSCYEGPCDTSGKTFPVASYHHDSLGGGHCSVTGGYVYRGTLYQFLRGYYFFADFCSGRIWTISGTSTASSLTPTLRRDTSFMISSFGEGYTGELYFTTLSGGVYRITATET